MCDINNWKTPTHFIPKDTFPRLAVVEIVPAQRTTARIATLEPLEQTAAMKRVLTRRALLIRQLPVRTHDTVTNGTFRLPLHSSRHIPPPRQQAIDDRIPLPTATSGEADNALSIDDPKAPFLLRDPDAVDRLDFRAGERVRGGQADGDTHGLFVDGDRGGDFAGGGGDFDGHWLVRSGLRRGGPFADDGEFLGDDERGDVFLRPGFDGRAELTGCAVPPPVFGYRGQPSQTEIVQVNQGTVRLLFGHLVALQTGCLEIVFRGIDGLLPPVDEDVEYEVQ